MDNLETLDKESFEAPESRIKDAYAGWQVYDKMRQDDNSRSKARANVQKMLDGSPPLKQEALIAAGQGHRTNVNWLEGDAARSQALAPFFDLVYSVDTLASIRTEEGDAQEKDDRSAIISEEFHKMLMNWSQFSNRVQEVADGFVVWGLCFPYFDNTLSWKFKVGRLGRVKIPDGTPLDEDEFSIVCIEQDMCPAELYRNTISPVSGDRGWKGDACKRAIVHYAGSASANRTDNWEDIQAKVKNNDLYLSHGPGAQRIPVVHHLVREFSGKISHYIGLQESGLSTVGRDHKEGEWLFEHPGEFSDINQALVMFNAGVGNGTVHSVRGLGYKIYSIIQTLNKVRCNAVDAANLGMGVIAQPETANAQVDMGMTRITPGGGLNILPANIKLVPNASPDLSRSGFPIMQEMQRLVAGNSGNFQTHQVNPSNVERTKAEINLQAERDSILQNNMLNMWYVPWEKLLKQIYIRAIKGQDDTSKAFIDQCIKRGVPKEALSNFSTVKAKRAAGNGSPQLRSMAQEKILGVSGSFDENGRYSATRDFIMSVPGVDLDSVNRYMPMPEPRPTLDHEFAQLENATISLGQDIQVQSTQNHLVHAQEHIKKLMQDIQMITEQQADPAQLIQGDIAILEHTKDHAEFSEGDKQREVEWGQVNQQIQQIEAFLDKVEQETVQQQQAEQAGQDKVAGRLTPEQEQILEFERQRSMIKLEEAQMLSELRMQTEITRGQNDNKPSGTMVG
jgi:hypothetical protein